MSRLPSVKDPLSEAVTPVRLTPALLISTKLLPLTAMVRPTVGRATEPWVDLRLSRVAVALSSSVFKVKVTAATVKLDPDRPLTPAALIKEAMLVVESELSRPMDVPLMTALTGPVAATVAVLVLTVMVPVSKRRGVKLALPVGT